jgi:hypothetical protein
VARLDWFVYRMWPLVDIRRRWLEIALVVTDSVQVARLMGHTHHVSCLCLIMTLTVSLLWLTHDCKLHDYFRGNSTHDTAQPWWPNPHITFLQWKSKNKQTLRKKCYVEEKRNLSYQQIAPVPEYESTLICLHCYL